MDRTNDRAPAPHLRISRRGLLGASAAIALVRATPAWAVPAYAAIASRVLGRLLVAPRLAGELREQTDIRIEALTALQRTLEQMPPETDPGLLTEIYDDLYTLFASISNTDLNLVHLTHPDPAMRAAAEQCVQLSAPPANGVTLSRPIYEHLARVRAAAAMPVRWHFMLDRQLEIFRRSGVALDGAARMRTTSLQDDITASASAFQANISADVREVLARPEELVGLPPDYLASHPVRPDGFARISTSGVDTQPVFRYARSSALRQRVMTASLSRGYPANDDVLKTIFAKRREFASLLGYPSYAHFDLANRMVGTPERAQRFLDDIADAARPAARRDGERMLRRLQRDDPAIRTLNAWDSAFASALIQKEEYDVDPAIVRQYLRFPKVKNGILRLAERLFQISIVPWEADVWAPDVGAFEVRESGRPIGRFFLDLHPREGKYTHAAIFPLRIGSRQKALPLAALVMNLPTELMEHSQVRTFLHEFGHLLHWIFAGQVEWSAQNFYEIENDVIETPSQLLEEWAFDYDTLRGFATNDDGAPIPRDLVARMNAGRRFGDAFSTMNQLGYAAAALALYRDDPSSVDLTDRFVNVHQRYAIASLPAGVHPHASFTHLSGYGPSYYTYQWSKALAVDLLSQFRQAGLSDVGTARRYRQTILAPGGSESMNVLARRFLGRDWSVRAYRDELEVANPQG